MKVADAWTLLGVEPTDDPREVKRAYGRQLKRIDVEADPAAFIRLREARDVAASWGTQTPEWEGEDEDWPLDVADLADPPPPSGDPAAGHHDDGDFLPEPVPYPAWRPELPDDRGGELAELRRQLDEMLFAGAPADPAQAAALFEALIRACASASVDDASATERWLLATLAAAIPRSDPLIVPALRHFRWDSDLRPHDYSFELDLGDLEQRLADRRAMQEMKGTLDPNWRAIEELRRPGRTRLGMFELGLARDVRQFLDHTLAAHPTLRNDLDPEAMAWWEAYLRGRHLPAGFWLQIACIPLALTALVAAAIAAGDFAPGVTLAHLYPAALLATLLAIFAVAELRARRASREEQWLEQGYSGRRAEPWLVAALLLPLLAALIAFSWVTMLLWNVAAAIVAVGGYLNTRTPPKADEPGGLFIPGFPVTTAVAALTVLALLPVPLLAHVAGPFAALCFLAYRGHEAAAVSLDGMLAARLVRAVRAAVAVLLAVALILLFAFVPEVPPAMALVLMPVAVGWHHLATADVFFATARLEWGIRVAALIFYFTLSARLFGDRDVGLAIAILLYALVYALVRTILSLGRAGQKPEPASQF